MESSLIKKNYKRGKRVVRVRKRLRGTQERPRLCVMKSNKHIGVQLIDDEKAVTIASASTLMNELKKKKLGRTKEAARVIGAKIAELAKKNQVEKAVFDRGIYKYHGIIAELANAAREGGLQF